MAAFATRLSPEDLADRRGLLLLWSAWLAGPLAWALQENISYALVPWVCTTGNAWALHAVSFVTLVVAVYAGAAAGQARRLLASAKGRAMLGEQAQSRCFLATGGLLICTLCSAGIVAGSIPNFIVDACARAT